MKLFRPAAPFIHKVSLTTAGRGPTKYVHYEESTALQVSHTATANVFHELLLSDFPLPLLCEQQHSLATRSA